MVQANTSYIVVEVLFLSEEKDYFEVESEDTVQTLKDLIDDRFSFAYEYYLTYNGNQIESGATLKSYGIRNGSILNQEALPF